MNIRTRLLLRIGLLLVLCMAISYCIGLSWVTGLIDNGPHCDTGPVQFTHLESMAYAKFPPSVANAAGLIRRAPTSCTFHLRFEIAPADLDAFLRSTRIRLPLEPKPGLQAFDAPGGPNPWTPDPNTAHLYGRGPSSLDYTQWVYVETGNRAKHLVYLIVEKYWD